MSFKENDWVTHPKYGTGQVQTVSEKAYSIRFTREGTKDILTAFALQPGQPPIPGFSFSAPTKAKRGALNPRSKTLRPVVSFGHLLERFVASYPSGFSDPKYLQDERDYKLAAAQLLEQTLNRDRLQDLIADRDYEAVRKAAQSVASATNLIFPIELAKMSSGLKTPEAKADFALALFDLLYGSNEQAIRFDHFASVQAKLGFPIWTIATIFPFFATRGASMFMKISVSKFIAASVGIPLEYETLPNSRTLDKLQQIAAETASLLRAAGHQPRDGFDTQSFMFVTWFELEGIHQRNRSTAKGGNVDAGRLANG